MVVNMTVTGIHNSLLIAYAPMSPAPFNRISHYSQITPVLSMFLESAY